MNATISYSNPLQWEFSLGSLAKTTNDHSLELYADKWQRNCFRYKIIFVVLFLGSDVNGNCADGKYFASIVITTLNLAKKRRSFKFIVSK